ncbi:DNA primase [Arcanobacterium pluranimalium]|uniref:DNA primase n=1 Tax=Arcanobacterium pluranimalium TaxID=108028 RepID=UPI00195B6253|nr:DNA primase [Arcanobacterium pluranimalium]MBM7825573.1 DNA primase [Arcanobacterium pluranimalium]
MAGLIKRDIIDEVRERTRIEDVISEYITLKSAGTGSLKGLCPFHDEKTPSFNVRPHVGRWHCFGCGEGGDAISFVERIEHISFVEAVEMLARKAGIHIEYEEDSAQNNRSRRGEPTRSRLVDAHRIAQEFYMRQLLTPEGKAAKEMLYERGFDDAVIASYQIGYSPNTWDSLLKELRKRGFTEKEILASGLATQGTRGIYDRFRGRVMWPIHSITGDPIGFGARKMNNDDEGPKYLNTPETSIYKKSQVLYGLDRAKKAISSDRKIVVVEGYTDVMAAHLAGIPHAVATCGTAFGHEHVKIARRLLRDTQGPSSGVILHTGQSMGGEVIFTFDGDAAGQKAAIRAFQEDQNFGAQTFVAISPGGLDPCDVRMKYGDAAVREIIASREPLFAFVIRSLLKDVSLHTAEGRAAGLRAAAPIVASIKDRVLRSEYTRELSGWLGMDENSVRMSVDEAHKLLRGATAAISQFASNDSHDDAVVTQSPALKEKSQIVDPVEKVERAALEIAVQLPRMAMEANIQSLPSQSFIVPVHRAIFDRISAVGSVGRYQEYLEQLIAQGIDPNVAESRACSWYVNLLMEDASSEVRRAIAQLSVEPIAEDRPSDMWRYVRGVMMSLVRHGFMRQIAEVRGEMQRCDDPAQQAALFERLIELEKQRRLFDETDT